MTNPTFDPRLADALSAADSSTRLRAAMAAGTSPHVDLVPLLLERCAVEPDFFVRDTLSWALLQHPREATVPLLMGEVRRGATQARAQALHTLSKIADAATWPAITPDLLDDPDDDVARAAWRAAVRLAPLAERPELAAALARQFGRGGRDVRISLSRALVELGDAALPVVTTATEETDHDVRVHALATLTMLRHPDEGFDAALWEAQRAIALLGAPGVEGL